MQPEPAPERLPTRSWLKDRRTIVLGLACAVAGALVTLLVVWKPWRLPPDWGDIPTWLTFGAGSVAAWFVLAQLRQQQAVIAEDIARSRRRDELLDGQLRELADRERARQREQAKLINVTPRPIRTGAGSNRAGECRIVNGSKRPVRQVDARMIRLGTSRPANGFAVAVYVVGPGLVGSQPHWENPGPNAVRDGAYRNLLAEQEIIARFEFESTIDTYEVPAYVVRFTDDAGLRWELDGDMHLRRAPDEDW